jgi:tetratricopeptide (TPR) repeat protein
MRCPVIAPRLFAAALLCLGAFAPARGGNPSSQPAAAPGGSPSAAPAGPAPVTPETAGQSAGPPEAVPRTDPGRQARVKDAYHRAAALANDGNLAGAQKVVDEFGDAQGRSDPYYDELQGTVLAIAKDYPAAQAAFERMLAKTPNSHIGRFNRAEMIMLQARYDDAEKEFAAVEELASGRDPAVADLCRFKRIMCFLSAGKLTAADLLVPPLQENSESPALCYARAALAWAKHHTTKAVQLLEDAHTRFSEPVENLYTDSLVELRWGQRDETGRFFFKPRLR